MQTIKPMSEQEVCDLLSNKLSLSQPGLRTVLNGDQVSINIGTITGIVNAALAKQDESSPVVGELPQDERERFEAKFGGRFDMRRDFDKQSRYYTHATNWIWESWQAALAQRPIPASSLPVAGHDLREELKRSQAMCFDLAACLSKEAMESTHSNETYGWRSVDGSQHDTGRVTRNGGSYFATTSSPDAARFIATALNSLAAPVPAAAPAVLTGEDKLAAARWNALLGSARIRMIGCAGLHPPEPNNYAHLGMEIWTKYGSSLNQDQLEQMAKGNALGREWLTKYADIAIAAAGAKTEGGEHV